MAGKKPDTGASAVTVAANVKRLRTKQNLTYTQLSERLVGWSLSPVAIRRIEETEPEQPQRRVDVDDLVALAAALEVSPLTLLMPETDSPEQSTAATSIESVPAVELWHWLRTDLPIGATSADIMRNLEFQLKSKPSWHLPEMVDYAPMSPADLRRIADEHEQKSAYGND